MAISGNVAEVFRSWQGEGLLMGHRQVFVRLAGCQINCRYCDTAWAFETPKSVALPGMQPAAHATGAPEVQRWANPLSVEQVLEMVEAADPGGECVVSLTGGEPLEQPEFACALMDALGQAQDDAAGAGSTRRPRKVMLETAGLHAEHIREATARAQWVACDLKLPSSTGQAQTWERFTQAAETGAFRHPGLFFKLVVDGDTTANEMMQAKRLLLEHAPQAVVFLQPVTPLGGSPGLPTARLEELYDALAGGTIDLRVVPQVHKLLKVR